MKDISGRTILNEKEFNSMREFVLKSTYKEIQENIFTKYGCNCLEFKALDSFGKINFIKINEKDEQKMSDIRYLFDHINSHYWMFSYNIKGAIIDSHIEFTDYNGYIICKLNNLRLSFILFLSFWDSIKNLINEISELNLKQKKEISLIVDKYSDIKNAKINTKFLDFTEFKSFPIFDENNWKMTFRNFANHLKHNDDLLINLKYELVMKNRIKERIKIEERDGKKYRVKILGGIKTNIDDFNKFYYDMCINNLIESATDLAGTVNFILKYLKEESKLKKYFIK